MIKIGYYNGLIIRLVKRTKVISNRHFCTKHFIINEYFLILFLINKIKSSYDNIAYDTKILE